MNVFQSILTKRRKRAIDHLHEVNSNDLDFVHVCEIDDFGEVLDSKKWRMPVGGELYFVAEDRATRLTRVKPTVFLCIEFFFHSGPCTIEEKTKWLDLETFDLSYHYIKKMSVTEKHVNAFYAADTIKSYGKKWMVSKEDFDTLTSRIIPNFFIKTFENVTNQENGN